MIRILSFLALTFVAFSGPVWVFLLAALIYGLYFSGLELVFLCIAVDAVFMNEAAVVPIYTLGSIVWLAVVEYIKPYVTLYQQV